MRIAFFLQRGSPNRGAEAIIRGFSELMSSANQNVEIVLFSASPEEDKRANIELVKENINRKNIKRFSFVWLLQNICSRMNVKLNWLIKYQYKHILDEQNKFDLIIITGADNYDIFYNTFEDMHELNKLLRSKMKSKMLLYNCSIDEAYFFNATLRKKLQNDLNLFDAVTVREQITNKNINKYLRYKELKCFPDPAFVMPATRTVLPGEWKNGSMIGINLSSLIVRNEYGAGVEKIKSSYHYLIEKIINETGFDIVFIPHVMQGKDLSILTELYEGHKNTNRVVLINNEKLFAPELKYIISQCRFLIAARTHASIAAYSTCVPTLVLGYSIKSIGIAQDLFGTEEGYVIPVQKLNNKTELWNAFSQIMLDEHKIRMHLQKNIPEYQSILKNFVPFISSLVKT